MKQTREIVINFDRINEPRTRFTEGFLEDDGVRLLTYTVIPEKYSRPWSERWVKMGMLPPGQYLNSVKKYHFYGEYFTILEYRNEEGQLLGYYCDVATPLEKRKGEYFIKDLLLDLWIGANGEILEFDLDEFDEAVAQGQISFEEKDRAKNTFQWMKEMAKEERFPGDYIR